MEDCQGNEEIIEVFRTEETIIASSPHDEICVVDCEDPPAEAISAGDYALQQAKRAEAATAGAETVNATLSGSILYVTDRNGNTTFSNVKGEKGDTGELDPETLADINHRISLIDTTTQEQGAAILEIKTYLNNEVAPTLAKVGNLQLLTTENKNTLVESVNEVKATLESDEERILFYEESELQTNLIII